MLSSKAYRLTVLVIACLLVSVEIFAAGTYTRSLYLMPLVDGLCWAEFIRVDAREKGLSHPRVLYFIAVVAPLFAVPYHLYQTRGFRKTLGALLGFFVWLVILVLLGLAVGTIALPK